MTTRSSSTRSRQSSVSSLSSRSSAAHTTATRLAGELRPDVVLMDLSMPVVDGFEASRRIGAQAAAPVVIVLTGSSYAGDVEKARVAGTAGYVTKDRIAQDLVRTVLAAVA
jgi:two-component system, response regulator PdtaR